MIFATKRIDPWATPGCVFTRYSGGVNLLDPDPETIDLRDIELGMSRIVRYNGQTKDAITIGEHCVRLADWYCWLDLEIHLLLHDAAEAYIGDIVSPLKALLPTVKEIESKLISAIYVKFGLTEPDWKHIHAIEAEYFDDEFRAAQLGITVNRDPWIDRVLRHL